MTKEDRVKKIIETTLGVKYEKITPKASFVDDLGADSLDGIEIIMGLEEEFDIEISDEVAEKMRTVADAIKYIELNTI